MTFKPRRFCLPAIAVLFSGLLMWLEVIFHTQNILGMANDVLNFPASTAYYYLTIHMGRGNYLYPFPGWPDRALYLVLVGLCWYLVGIELDFRLLQRTAARLRLLRVTWVIISVCLQVFVIWVFCFFMMDAFRQKPGERFEPIAIAYCLIFLAWFQTAALRFWKAQQKSNGQVAHPVRPSRQE